MSLLDKLFGTRRALLGVTELAEFSFTVFSRDLALTADTARDVAEAWCARSLDAATRDKVLAYCDRNWGELLVVRAGAPDEPWVPAAHEDEAAWSHASEPQRRAVRDATRVIRITSCAVPGRRPVGLLSALAIAHAVVDACGGVIYDPLAARFVRPMSISLDVKVSDHISFLSWTDDDERGTLVVRGLEKFGLDGFTWAGYPAALHREVVIIANEIATALVRALRRQAERGRPPLQLVLPEDFELCARVRIGLRVDDRRCTIVPPSSFRGAMDAWVPAVWEQLTVEAGLATLRADQRAGWDTSKAEHVATLAALGRVAIGDVRSERG